MSHEIVGSGLVDELRLDLAAPKEPKHTGIVRAGEVRSEAENHQRLGVLTYEYIKRHYLDPDDPNIVRNNGVYVDKYEQDPTALRLATVSEGVVNGSLRLVMDGDYRLPIQEDDIVNRIKPEYRGLVEGAKIEWTQFAKSRKVASDPRPTTALIRAGIQASRNLGENGGVGVIDTGVYTLLTGPRYNFTLHKLSDEFMYMGSMCLPISFDFDELLEASRQKGHTELVDFINTGNAPGFEWYQGI